MKFFVLVSIFICLISGFDRVAVAGSTIVNSIENTAAKEIKVSVKGMVCAFCAQGITKKFKAEPSVAKVDVSLEKKLVSIELKKGEDLSDDKISQILKDSGYSVDRIERPTH